MQVSESTSLFTYQFGENVYTFSNKSFVPMFIEDLKFYNESLKKQAYAACQGDINCLFDSASTKDVSLGLSTKIVGSQMVNESNTLKNFPPEFENTSSILYVTEKVWTSVTFRAKDPDGDKIRFSITGPPDDATVWTNESLMTLGWMVTKKSVKLEIIATDNKGATSVLRPVLHVCACNNGGDCLTTNQEDADRNNSRFKIMPCQCLSGYTGRFCESEIDACEVNMNPCYPEVQCKDLPAPADVTGYECGPCPPGFSGQGDSCSDFDECDSVTHGCSQICTNTPGSFACNCNQGYVLNADGRTCDDVNECDPASDCMQGCVNTPGSYRCTCDKYFTVDSTNPKKCIMESPCKEGNHQCQHICYVSNGTNHCTCQPGYELQHDNKSCSDIDECTTGKNRCNQDCRNTIGWYYCECRLGYRLDTDNVTCVDIDECLEWTFNCSFNLRCRNAIGSYKCECRKGFVWNGNECQEPEKPATTRPLSTPRPSSEKDVQNSVNVTIQELDITEWNEEKDLHFKNAVSQEVNEFCAKDQSCFEHKIRVRRPNDRHVIFTAQQVHLLPGYPVQLSYSSIPDHVIAAVAFYAKFPPGFAIGVTDTVDGDLLVDIVNGSLGRIGRAINKTILSVSAYMDENPTYQPTTKPTLTTNTEPTDTRDPKEIPGYVRYPIIGLSVVGILLTIFIKLKP
ncbi:mucin-like protein isoform X5 [Actinia tenebrosa]|uniref:Mucin-like protein isoform X5 n=1 Tax=Actinia tenebrosa TaxID=6105 RepID=A0A6P8JBZ7_ACTTE|nr:mucin-like protein isoform X5 [Actinia tenebrosa]